MFIKGNTQILFPTESNKMSHTCFLLENLDINGDKKVSLDTINEYSRPGNKGQNGLKTRALKTVKTHIEVCNVIKYTNVMIWLTLVYSILQQYRFIPGVHRWTFWNWYTRSFRNGTCCANWKWYWCNSFCFDITKCVEEV